VADITHCGGKACPLKETCYRYTAGLPDANCNIYTADTLFKSWFVEAPYDFEKKDCDYYWGNK